ncbi:MAG TPA: BatD family protein [Thermoanaerobaculia bacterium]
MRSLRHPTVETPRGASPGRYRRLRRRRRPTGRLYGGVAILFLFLFALPASAAVELKATLEPETIGIDQTATFTIEMHGDGFSSLRFHPDFEMDNLEVLGNSSKYEDMTFSNGHLSRTLRVSWQVRPLGLGKARVRGIVVHLDDEARRLPAMEIKVQQEPTGQIQRLPHGAPDDEDPFQRFFGRMPGPWRREPQQPDVFLRAEVQPARPVVGQQVLYTIYLYTRENIAGISPSGIPTFRGFWVRDIPLPQQLPTEMIDLDGRRYGRVPLIKKALFPLRPGPYRLEPATIDLTVERYDRSFFFGPAVARPESVRLQTPPQTVDVQPLPPAPPGFGGAVGQISLAAQLEPKEVHLGEAATLTVRLSGVGNLQGIQEPRLKTPPGLTLLPPQQEGKDDLNGSAVRGTRIWRYAVVPERAGRFTLDAPKITYFDPAESRYQVAAAPDLALAVLAPPAAKPAAGAPAIRTAGLQSRPWSPVLPWLVALPWGLGLVVALVRQRSARNGAGIGESKGEEARRLQEALCQAEAEQRPRQMAVRIEEAWRELLHRRWGVPRETPPSRWRELLAGQGVEGEALDELDLLIEDLRYLRFAPQLSTTDAMRADALARCRRLLRRLS